MKLTKDEKNILKSFDNDEWLSSPTLAKDKKKLQEIAKATLRKDRRVNIRISNRDLKQLQRKAVHEGLPYQTFIASILHKFVNGRYSEQPSH